MKPNGNPPGLFFNFDAIAQLICPNLWNEEVDIKFRWLLFLLCYTTAALTFMSIIILPISLIFDRSFVLGLKIIFLTGVPCGIGMGYFDWRDFQRRSQ